MVNHHRDSWIVRPLKAFWHLIALIVGSTGRLVAVVIGAVLMILGRPRFPDDRRRGRRNPFGRDRVAGYSARIILTADDLTSCPLP